MKQEMMKAGVLTGPQRIEIRQVPVPEMAPGMLKIRVSACGVCGSDIHMWKAGKAGTRNPSSIFIWGMNSAAWLSIPATAISASAIA